MSFFITIFDQDDSLDKAKELLQEHYPDDHHQYHSNPKLFLIDTKDIADKIAQNIGIKNDEYPDIVGAVFKLNGSYAGFTNGSVWDWLGRNE